MRRTDRAWSFIMWNDLSLQFYFYDHCAFSIRYTCKNVNYTLELRKKAVNFISFSYIRWSASWRMWFKPPLLCVWICLEFRTRFKERWERCSAFGVSIIKNSYPRCHLPWVWGHVSIYPPEKSWKLVMDCFVKPGDLCSDLIGSYANIWRTIILSGH